MVMCKNLADRLNEIRKARNLSIAEFAEELGIARSSLQVLLSGTGNPRTDTIECIADQLGIDPVWLLSDQQEPPLPPPPPFDFQQLNQMQSLLEYLKELLGEEHE